ncbi:heme/hemin ABC transporter substrate-binding protein [Microterricola viridarii]|uniref:Iron complex transport system substrate-binding protein n=1 Tax=Microterricola viridarii TaxID=412690 RepID=A0A1H1NVN9_9MICO|nr:ABC transporter substrate-binding protein [Microterricola viridarii]SDS02429.1 iron complex transport system substrate-binding protein [Microterricola viridarii]
MSSPLSSRAGRRPFRFGTPAFIGATLTLLMLTGCAGPTAGPGTAESAQRECVASEIPLTELAVLDAPRDWVGPSTACLADAGITAIDSPDEPQLPVTVIDDKGTEVTVTDASRILAVDVSGSLAATVFGLGLGDRVVGRDSSTGFAEAAGLPLVTTGGHQLSAEPILGLAPTVILTDTTLGPPAVIEQLRDAGIPVVITTSKRNIDTIGTVIEQVAAALGVPDAGERLTAQLHADLAAVQADVEAIAPTDPAERPRMLFLYLRGSAGVYYLFGEESGADALITSIGGRDVAGEIGWQGMRPVTAEALVEAAPDLVLLMTKGLDSVNGVDGLLESIPALASTPAGQNRRFVDMSDTEILSFGPRTPQVLDALARAVYAPEQSGPIGE